jgi:hypothetical protein
VGQCLGFVALLVMNHCGCGGTFGKTLGSNVMTRTFSITVASFVADVLPTFLPQPRLHTCFFFLG